MSYLPKFITVHGKDCLGCKNSDTDIMLSFQENTGKPIHDILLTKEIASALMLDINNKLLEAKKDKYVRIF